MSTVVRLRGHLGAHHEWYWAPLGYAAVVLALYHAILFPPDGVAQGFGWDTIESYWPDLAFLANRLKRGETPLWNPFDRGGWPVVADPERGLYYPINWAFAALGALAGETSWWLIQLKMLLHHALAGTMLHLFLRSRGLGRFPAFLGGVTWIVSAPMLIHKASTLFLPLVYAPLCWVMIDRVFERATWRRGCALAFAVVLGESPGSPPGFFYFLLLSIGYGTFRLLVMLRTLRRDGRGRILSLALALGVAAAVAVPMLLLPTLPALEFMRLSPRATPGPAWALSVPLPVQAGFLGLLSPPVGVVDAYVGLCPLLLTLCALTLRPGFDRGAAPFFVVGAVLFLALALGKATPLLPWLVEHVPGFRLFRVADRYKLLAAPMWAAAAGYGLAALGEAPARTRTRFATLATVGLFALAVGLVVALGSPVRGARAPGTSLLFLLMAAVCVSGLLLIPRRAAILPAAALLLLTGFDPQYFVRARGPVLEARPDDREDLTRIESLEGAGTTYRIYDEFVLEQRAGTRHDRRDFRGYPAGDPLTLTRYEEVLRYAGKTPEILEAFNVRWLLYGPHHRAGTRANFIAAPPHTTSPEHFRIVSQGVWEALHPAPWVAWYGAARVVERGVLAALRQAEADDGSRRVAVLEPDAIAKVGRWRVPTDAEAAPPSVAGRVIAFAPDRVRAVVDAPERGVVVLNEVQYPGWEVTVDGRREASITANYLLRGVVVEAGRHELEWTFRPRHYGLLGVLWLLGAAVMVFAAWPWRKAPPAGPVHSLRRAP